MGREIASKRKIKLTYRAQNPDVFIRRSTVDVTVKAIKAAQVKAVKAVKAVNAVNAANAVKEWHTNVYIQQVKTRFLPNKKSEYKTVKKSDDMIKDYVNSLVCAKAMDLRAYHVARHRDRKAGEAFVQSMNYLALDSLFLGTSQLPQ